MRNLRGFTQQELADRAGMTKNAIGKIESPPKDKPVKQPRKIDAIAAALECSPAYLLFGHAELEELDQEAISLAMDWMRLPQSQKLAIKQTIIALSKSIQSE